MKYIIKLILFVTAAAMIMLPEHDLVYARGGHFSGGGHRSGGWSGGRDSHHSEHGDHTRPSDNDHHDNNKHHDNHNHDNDNNNDNNVTRNVNVYGGGGYWGGGWGWGAADGAIAGLAAGAVINAASQPSTVVVEQQAPEAQPMAAGSTDYGTQITALPAGAVSRNVNGTMAYQCGSVWYRPYFGSSGVYYEVVPPPPTDT